MGGFRTLRSIEIPSEISQKPAILGGKGGDMETFLWSLVASAVVGLTVLVFQRPTLYDRLQHLLQGIAVLGVLATGAYLMGMSGGARNALRDWPIGAEIKAEGNAVAIKVDGKVAEAMGALHTSAWAKVAAAKAEVWPWFWAFIVASLIISTLGMLSVMVQRHEKEEARKKKLEGP